MQELWQPVVGYETRNEISNLGRVRSLSKNKLLKVRTKPNDPYPFAVLRKDGAYQVKRIHRLVAEAFLPNPDQKACVNHIDFDKTNNCVSNLEWSTFSENTKHTHKHGRANIARGSATTMAKLTEADVLGILQRLDAGEKAINLISDYPVCVDQISKIRNGLAWAHVAFDRSSIATPRHSAELIQALKTRVAAGETYSALGRAYQLDRKVVKRLTNVMI